MLKNTVLLLLLCATCYSDIPVSTPGPLRVICGETPTELMPCLGNPTIFNFNDATKNKNCLASDDPGKSACDKMTCVFRNAGWFNGPTVIKEKVVEQLDAFLVENPKWAASVRHAKATCLRDDLPAQGYFLNCPAYDITMCTLASFVKHAQPSQWSSSPKCEYPRQYAAFCPFCPQECYSPAIPIGSCNLCYATPRMP